MTFPGRAGRWGVRVSTFRERGLPHRLLVLADLTRTLREEELQAWKRLVRVLGHELNNSLAPIQSIAGSLRKLLERDPRPDDWLEDARRGLSVIETRSEALSRFLAAYARLAKLPPPRLAEVDVAGWVERVVRLETRLAVRLAAGPPVKIRADRDQLDQLLINLVNNAVDASLETGGGVAIGWEKQAGRLEIVGPRRRAGARGQRQSLRAVLHDEGSGIGHRASAEPADRRRPRRHGDAGEPHPRPRLRSARAAAPLNLPVTSNSICPKY